MRAIAFFVLSCFASSATAESWLCVSDDNVGFDYDKSKKTWVQARFSMEEKFVVRPSKVRDYKWEVIEVGEEFPSYYCDKDFTESGYLTCATGSDFRFNKKTLRFTVESTHGFFGDVEALAKRGQRPDSMYVMYGRCTSI